MSSLELESPFRPWSRPVRPPASVDRARFGQLLPAVARAILLLVDVALILGAFLLAYWVRFIVPDAEASALGLEQYASRGLLVALGTALLFALQGLYDVERPQPWFTRLHTIVSVVSTVLVAMATVSFFIGDHQFSRVWFAVGWVFAALGLVVWRTGAQALYGALHNALAPPSRVLVVGANAMGHELARELDGSYEVVGYVDDVGGAGGPGAASDRASEVNGYLLGAGAATATLDFPLLAPIAQLEQVVDAHEVDELIIALPANQRDQVSRAIARGFSRQVRVKFLAGLDDLLPKRFEIHRVGGRPYIAFAPAAPVSWLKRATDLLLGSLILIGLVPLMLLITLAIKLDSPGPVIYRQQRVGKDGRLFWMLKFRSMRVDADQLLEQLRSQNEASGPIFKMRRDPRITRVGRVLRRLSLDELPQIFNVLKGEMSLVGPRPPLPAEVAQYEDWQLGRLRAIPGMTGLWQVSGRSEISFQDMVKLDLHYIRNWSLALDLELLVRTVRAVLTSRGAY